MTLPCWRVEVRRDDGEIFAPVIGAPDEDLAAKRALALAALVRGDRPERRTPLARLFAKPRSRHPTFAVQSVTMLHDGHRPS